MNWNEIVSDCKLATVMLAVVSDWNLPNDADRTLHAQLIFGDKFPATASSILDALENYEGFVESINIDTHPIMHAARQCYEAVKSPNAIDKNHADELSDQIDALAFIFDAIPKDSYGFGGWDYSAILMPDRALSSLIAAARARHALVEYAQSFPQEDELVTGFSIANIAELGGMTVKSVSNFASSKDKTKPLQTIFGQTNKEKQSGYVVCDPIDTIEWLAGRKHFQPGGLTEAWVNECLERIKTRQYAAALPGIYSWLNKVTSNEIAERAGWAPEEVSAWMRGQIEQGDRAAQLAKACHINPERYVALIERATAA